MEYKKSRKIDSYLGFHFSCVLNYACDNIFSNFSFLAFIFNNNSVDDIGTVLILNYTDVVAFQEVNCDRAIGVLIKTVVLFNDDVGRIILGTEKNDRRLQFGEILSIEVEYYFEPIVGDSSNVADEFIRVVALNWGGFNCEKNSFFIGLDLVEFFHEVLGDIIIGGYDVDGVTKEIVLQLQVVLEADSHCQECVEEFRGTVQAEHCSSETWKECGIQLDRGLNCQDAKVV